MASIDDLLVEFRDDGVPAVSFAELEAVASPTELQAAHIRKVKATLLAGALGKRVIDRRYGSIAALRLINARLPACERPIWRPGETYAEICKRRLDLLNGLYPEW